MEIALQLPYIVLNVLFKIDLIVWKQCVALISVSSFSLFKIDLIVWKQETIQVSEKEIETSLKQT